MKFSELVEQVSALLEKKRRMTYRALKREFDLDDETLADVKEELIKAAQVGRDENGEVLVWVGAATVVSSQLSVVSPRSPIPSFWFTAGFSFS